MKTGKIWARSIWAGKTED